MALGCMFFATFTYIILRWLRNVHYGLVTFFYGFYVRFYKILILTFVSEIFGPSLNFALRT